MAVLLAAILAGLAYEVALGRTAGFDDTVRNALHHFASPTLTSAMILITRAGAPEMLWVYAAIASFFLWKSGERLPAAMLILAMTGGAVLNEALKYAFHRARPAAYFDYPLPHSFSFPSGHALFSGCFFGALAAVLSSMFKSKWQRIALWAGCCAAIAAIGASRVYLGVHYPTDVLGGYLAASIWVVTLVIGNRERLRRVQRA